VEKLSEVAVHSINDTEPPEDEEKD